MLFGKNMRLIPEAIKRPLLRHREIFSFGLIGIANTTIHAGIVVFLVEARFTSQVPANLIAFCIANVFSYYANARTTFRSSMSWMGYARFLKVSLLSLFLTVSISSFAQAMSLHYVFGLMLVIVLGPILTFVLHRIYTFRNG